MDINDVKNVASQIYGAKKAIDKNYAEIFKIAYNELLKMLHEKTKETSKKAENLFDI